MITILLPAYNEEVSLPALLPKLHTVCEELGQPYRIIVCDDGSTDRTDEVLKEYTGSMPIEILTHSINRGLGETSRDLFEMAATLSGPDDIIIRMDCDDTHDPVFIPAMIEKINQNCDVVVASRFEPGGGQTGVNGYRAFISRGANIFMTILFPIKGLKEYSCGFRAYRASMIQKTIEHYGNNFIQLKGLGFTCTLEKVVKLKLMGARFGEIPFVLRYDQKQSKSKMVTGITTLGYLVLAICYHWPWGGWRASHRRRAKKNAKG